MEAMLGCFVSVRNHRECMSGTCVPRKWAANPRRTTVRWILLLYHWGKNRNFQEIKLWKVVYSVFASYSADYPHLGEVRMVGRWSMARTIQYRIWALCHVLSMIEWP